MKNYQDVLVIEQMIKRYANNTDSGNAQDSVSLFLPDGVLDSPMGMLVGHDTLLSHLTEVANTVAKGKRHVMTNIVVSIMDDTATAESYMLVFDATNFTHLIMTATYQDSLIKREGNWYFKHRTLRIDPSFKPPGSPN